MSDLELILLGVALGAIPSGELAAIATTILAKKAGLKPGEIRRYSDAASNGDDTDDPDDTP